MTQTIALGEAAYNAARGVLPESARVVVIVLDGEGNASTDFDYDPDFSMEDVHTLITDAARAIKED